MKRIIVLVILFFVSSVMVSSARAQLNQPTQANVYNTDEENSPRTITITIQGDLSDGEVINQNCTAWSTCRGAVNGNFLFQGTVYGTVEATYFQSKYLVKRLFYFFDTSAIPSNASITSAKLNIYTNQFLAGTSTFHVVPSTANMPPGLADFSKIQFTSGGSATASPNILLSITLNSNALGWITKGGWTKLALIHHNDLNNIIPTETNRLSLWFAEQANYRPTLEITYQVSTDFAPDPQGYQFINALAHTSWDIFRETFGAENVDKNILALYYYAYDYKCTLPSPFGCNEVGSGGNCDGMAVSSMLIHKGSGWVDPPDFLASMNATHTVDLNEPTKDPNKYWRPEDSMTRFIVRYQGYQQGKQVQTEYLRAQSRSLMDSWSLIKQAIDGNLVEPQLIWLEGPDSKNHCAGHSLVPYAYRITGSSVEISVYDPNHPKIHTQIVSIDPINHSWVYDHKNPIGIWRSGQTCSVGLLSSKNTSLKVMPISAYRNHPIPPWSSKNSQHLPQIKYEDGFGYYISVGNNGSLKILDNQGRVLGNNNGVYASEIPGGSLFIPVGVVPDEDIDYPERYIITSTIPITINMIYSGTAQVPLFGIVPGGEFVVIGDNEEPSLLNPSYRGTEAVSDRILINPAATELSIYSESRGDERSMSLITQNGDTGRDVTIGNFALEPGNSSHLSINSDSSIITFTSNLMQNDYGIRLNQLGITSTVFLADGPPLIGDDILIVFYNWASQEATASIDRGGDGTIDETIILTNQYNRLYLPMIINRP